MARIVLTADRAIFTNFSGVGALGFGLCVPYRLIPWFLEYFILAPPVPITKNGRAKYAPYALAKVEAALLAHGFSRNDVIITPPEFLDKVISKDTKIVGIHVLDPQGLAPVSWTLRVLMGGGKTCTQYEFERLMKKIRCLRRKYNFEVIIGGPGVWQLRGLEDKFGIDVLFEGEAERTFPELVSKILRKEKPPKRVVGEQPNADEIPTIVTPSRNGVVEVTRGCPRRCHFCSPTMRKFRSIPLKKILKEAELNLSHGARQINLVTEDILIYGAKGLKFNQGAVMNLFRELIKLSRKYNVEKIGFSHVSLSSVIEMRKTVEFITDICNFNENEPCFPQVGLESGSSRIVAMYFRGKAYPWKPEDWPRIVLEGTRIMNENYWYPCLTYIIGFPGSTPDDYVKTTELLEKLRDEGFKGWTFPLLLIPMGGTLIERKARFQTLAQLPPEAIECITFGWKLSIKFSREIYPKLFRGLRNKIAKIVIEKSIDKALNIMENWIRALERDPSVIAERFSLWNVRALTSTIVSWISAKIRAREVS